MIMFAILLRTAFMKSKRDISIDYSGKHGGHSWGASGSYKDGIPSVSGGYGYTSGDGKHKFSISGDWSRNAYRLPRRSFPRPRPYPIDLVENGRDFHVGYSGEHGGHSWGASGSYKDGRPSVSGGYGYTSGDGKHKFSISGDWSRNAYRPSYKRSTTIFNPNPPAVFNDHTLSGQYTGTTRYGDVSVGGKYSSDKSWEAGGSIKGSHGSSTYGVSGSYGSSGSSITGSYGRKFGKGEIGVTGGYSSRRGASVGISGGFRF